MGKLFGTDGIRARWGEEPLTERSLGRLGAAIASVFADTVATAKIGQSSILIGRDTRASGPAILSALARGIGATGIVTRDLGVITTPGVAYAVRHAGALAGIVISASHNPAEDNGIKIFGRDGFKLADELEDDIEGLFEAGAAVLAVSSGHTARVRAVDVLEEGRSSGDSSTRLRAQMVQAERDAAAYERHLLLAGGGEAARPFAGKRLVVDGANGAASVLAPRVFRALGATVIETHCAPDGQNINRDCGALHPQTLARIVTETRADGGATFDGDADRVMLVDETGAVLDGDVLLALLARSMQARGQLEKNTVVGTVMANLGLERSLADIGVRLLRTPVGDRHVVLAMLQGGYALGGEQSGHVIQLLNGSTTGDGILCAVRALCDVFGRSQPLSSCRGLIEPYPQVLLNVRVRSKPDLRGIASVRDALVRVETELGEHGRVLLRYSGTEALARVMLEGREQAQIERLAQQLADAIRAEIGA